MDDELKPLAELAALQDQSRFSIVPVGIDTECRFVTHTHNPKHIGDNTVHRSGQLMAELFQEPIELTDTLRVTHCGQRFRQRTMSTEDHFHHRCISGFHQILVTVDLLSLLWSEYQAAA